MSDTAAKSEIGKAERERLESELNSGPEVDARREAALKRMLSTPRTAQKPAPTGDRPKRGRPPKQA
jgi:hypothetical protein